MLSGPADTSGLRQPRTSADPKGLPACPVAGARLLFVADTASAHTHRWAKWFRDRGARLTILSFHDEPIDGVEVIWLPPAGLPDRWYHNIPKLRMVLDYLPFRRLLRRLDPQLIHVHFVSEGGRSLYWRGVDVPTVCSAWGQDVILDEGPRPRVHRSLRRMFRKARYVTATTHQLARETARFTPAGKPIYVIPFGIDLAEFAPRPPPASPEGGADVVTLGFTKNLIPKYGPDVLIEAWGIIHKARPRTRLVMVGGGPMREQLVARAAALGAAEALEMVGRVPHERISELMRRFDVAVMPSVYDSETFGVAAVEASATGIPVVASHVGGVPEAVVHGKTGLLVPPRDPQKLAEACIRLIDDPALRRQMGEAGRRFVEANYVWRDNCLMMEEVYRAALEGREPQGVPVWREGVAAALREG